MIVINSGVRVRAKFRDEASRQTQRIDIDQKCTTAGYKNNLCRITACAGAPASNDGFRHHIAALFFFALRGAKLPRYRFKRVQKESGLQDGGCC